MGQNVVFNVGESFTIPAPTRSIEVQVGEIVVTRPRIETPDEDTPPRESVTVNEGETFDGKDQAGLVINDLAGSRVQIIYSDDDIESGRPNEADDPAAADTKRRAGRRARRKTASTGTVEAHVQKKAKEKGEGKASANGSRSRGGSSASKKDSKSSAAKRSSKKSSAKSSARPKGKKG